MTSKKPPEPKPQSVTFLTPDDLVPLQAQLDAQAAQLATHETTLSEHAAELAAHEAALADQDERITVLEEGAVEPPEPPNPDDVPVDKATWEANMIHYGIIHGDFLSTEQSIDVMLNHVYYDMARCMYQIADYTESPEPWNTYAKQAATFFRDQYTVPNNGAVPGYENFTHGLRMDYERTGDEASKAAAIQLSKNAMYAFDGTDLTYIASHARSREVAYAIMGYINAEKLGEPRRDQRAVWVTQSYDYIRQWKDEAAWGTGQISPFMFGITAQALIADWEGTQDARCLPAMLDLAEWMWGKGYHEPTHAMFYNINPNIDPAEGAPPTVGAPDLNMLIAPLYAWLYAQTGDAVHRERFDALLVGQANAYLAQGKQWDQNYWWSFDGMRWREGT